MPVLAVGDYLSILSAAHSTIATLYNAVQSIKNAPSEIEDIKCEAALVDHLLQHICQASSQEPNVPQLWPILKARAEKLAGNADRFVAKVTKTKVDRSQVKRVMWAWYRSEAKELAKQLREFHGTVGAVYSVVSVEMLKSAALSHIASSVHATNAGTSDIEEGQTLGRHGETLTRRRDHAHPEIGPEAVSDYLRYTGNDESNREVVEVRAIEASETSSMGAIPVIRRCPRTCQCRCHRPLRQLVPMLLKPLFGDIRVSPGAVAALVASAVCACDDLSCVEVRATVAIVRWLFPRWCAEINAIVRLQSCPVQIIIQTPRVVKDVRFDGTLDEMKLRMATREITVNDIGEDGQSLLHWLVFRAASPRHDSEEWREILQFVTERGAPTDWEFVGYTPVQWAVYLSHHNLHRLEWLERTIFRPLLSEDLDDACDGLNRIQEWTDLTDIIVRPSTRRAAPEKLAEMLKQPHFRSQLNAVTYHDGPLTQAARCCPEAVEILLRLGADPCSNGTSLILATVSVVSALVRAGADIGQALHVNARWYSTYCDRVYALELVRHAPHLLNWDEKDKNGKTPLDVALATHRAINHDGLPDEDPAFIVQLYKTRKLPIGSQFIDSTQLRAGASEVVANLESTSLISAAFDDHIPLPVIGELIRLGAMVNEYDHAGRTLLHLAAMGVVPRGYQIALEVVRHGGYGVNWDVLTVDGETANQLAEETVNFLQQTDATGEVLDDAKSLLELFRSRCLPDGEEYIYPCMHPKFCHRCFSYPCSGIHPTYWLPKIDCRCGCKYNNTAYDDEPRIPGAY